MFKGWGHFLLFLIGIILIVLPYSSVQASTSPQPGSKYMNVGQGDADIDYHFTAVVHNNETESSASIHFGWDRAYYKGGSWIGFVRTQKMFDQFEIQYILKSRSVPEMTESLCSRPADSEQWNTIDGPFDSGAGFVRGAKEQRDLVIRTEYRGEAFFRVVGISKGNGILGFAPFQVPLTCRTDTIRSLADAPDATTVRQRLVALDGVDKDEKNKETILSARIVINDRPAKEAIGKPGSALLEANPPKDPVATSVTLTVQRDPSAQIPIVFRADGYKDTPYNLPRNKTNVTNPIIVKLYHDKVGEVTGGSGDDSVPTGGGSVPTNANNTCNQYLGFAAGSFGTFAPLAWVVCQTANLTNSMITWISQNVTTFIPL